MRTRIITLSLIAISMFACNKETHADACEKKIPENSKAAETKYPRYNEYMRRTWNTKYPVWPISLTVQLNKLYPGKEIGC